MRMNEIIFIIVDNFNLNFLLNKDYSSNFKISYKKIIYLSNSNYYFTYV